MKDDPAIHSRTTYSVFEWGNGEFNKHINHPVSCPIPLMRVNEHTADPFQAFLTTFFPEDVCLLADGPNPSLNPEIDKNPAAAQQTAKGPLLFPSGFPVKWSSNHGVKICTVIEDDNQTCRVKVLGTRNILTLPKSSLVPVSSPEPAVIPETLEDIDMAKIQTCVTRENLERLWNGSSDDTQKDLDKLCLMWHHTLDHAPLVTIQWLAKMVILPKELIKVKKKPL